MGAAAERSVGVDRLVHLLAALVLGDIGRQGRLADQVDRLVDGALPCRGELEAPAAVGRVDGHNLGEQARLALVVEELDLGALLQALARLDQAVPVLLLGSVCGAFDLVQKQRLHSTAGAHLSAVEPGGKDAGLVDHQQIAGVQIVRNVPEDAVLDAPVLGHHHELAAVPGVSRCLGDEAVGKFVVEVVGSHISSLFKTVLILSKYM